MQRYFFDVRDSDGVIADEEGMVLLNIDAVQAEAARALAGMARDEVWASNGNRCERHLAIDIRDDSRVVMRAKFMFEFERLQ